MPDNSSSILSSGLSVEDKQWVRDLRNHRGFFLILQAVKELQESQLHRMVNQAELTELLRSQGSFKAFDKVLQLHDLLAQGKAVNPQGGKP